MNIFSDEFIEQHFGEIKETKENGDRIVRIPDHPSGDDKFRFSINPEKNQYFNYEDGVGGGYTTFLKENKDILGIENLNYTNKNHEKIQSGSTKEIILPDAGEFFNFREQNRDQDPAYKFLNKRGIPDQNIFGGPLAWAHSGYWNEYILLFYFEEEKLKGWTGRRFEGTGDRYKYLAGFKKSNYVFNIDSIREGSPVFVFEGALDALMLTEQIGVATGGADISIIQAKKIASKNPSKIILVPDNDEQSRKSLLSNHQTLQLRSQVPVLIFDEYNAKDIGEERLYVIPETKVRKFNKKLEEIKYRATKRNNKLNYKPKPVTSPFLEMQKLDPSVKVYYREDIDLATSWGAPPNFEGEKVKIIETRRPKC